jgi:hypothetical protein
MKERRDSFPPVFPKFSLFRSLPMGIEIFKGMIGFGKE